MKQSIFDLVIEHPEFFIGEFIFGALPGVLVTYGVVWLIMRPRNRNKLKPPNWTWHFIGILSSLFGTTTLRFLAMVTFQVEARLNLPLEMTKQYTFLFSQL